MPVVLRPVLALCALALVLPGAALATSVGQLFPSNALTTLDRSQLTGLRVNLPMPNCATNPSDCADVAVLNQLDGFNIQPRISIHFSGPIDLTTVSSHSIFLVGPRFHVVGINQIEWEPATNTLHVESDEQLAQDSTYVLVVTRGVRDAKGRPLDRIRFGDDNEDSDNGGHSGDRHDDEDFLPMAMGGGVGPKGIAGLSVFTTQSINAISTKIRSQLHGGPANFLLGTHGERTVFSLSSVSSVTFLSQTGTAPTFEPGGLFLPLFAGVGTIAFGTYDSPNYETAAEVIPAVGTRTGVPAVQSVNKVQFTLWLPAGTAPAGGWPVAIFGHGFTDSKDGAPTTVAGTLAGNGIATIAINVVGHGGGPLGTYKVTRMDGTSVVLPLGGRGIDQDGNGSIDSTEGVSAVEAQSLIGTRDGLRQTAIDLMQLVKVLKAGVDANGDGASDLSKSRIYYSGQSFGGIYGVQLLGLEPDIRAGVPNVPGGPVIEIARLSPNFRILVGLSLLFRSPSLYNAVPNAGLDNFNENIPLRNLPSVVDTVPGASAIQQLIDNTEWAQQSANPAAYAPFITRPIILQFARGDMTVPNPTTSAIIRAGNLKARTTLFRNDLTAPAFGTDKDPHTFLTNVFGPGRPFALQAQQQIATFFASDGATMIDPDGAGPFFETPTSMVPEDLAFLP
jgi:hypothetical protein